MKKEDMDNKRTFVIALLGVILALAPFAEEVKKISVDLVFRQYDLFTLIYFTFALLVISLYLYALDYLQYTFNWFKLNNFFNFLCRIGDVLYFLAVITPLLCLVLFAIGRLSKALHQLGLNVKDVFQILSYIISTGTVILAILKTIFRARAIKLEREMKADMSLADSGAKISAQMDQKKWRQALMEMHRSLELVVRKKLIDLNLAPKEIPLHMAVDLFKKNKFLTTEDVSRINYIRSLRSHVVHTDCELKLSEINDAKKIVEEIVFKLEKTTNFLVFEKEVFDALISEKGLFLKHHFHEFPNAKNKGFDAVGEGPGYQYFISAKATNNPLSLRAAAMNLQAQSRKGARKILVVPSGAIPPFEFPDTKILYYNTITKSFDNRNEIYAWIYGHNP